MGNWKVKDNLFCNSNKKIIQVEKDMHGGSSNYDVRLYFMFP